MPCGGWRQLFVLREGTVHILDQIQIQIKIKEDAEWVSRRAHPQVEGEDTGFIEVADFSAIWQSSLLVAILIII